MTDFELKSLSKDALERAADKAERYRLLNEPAQAESICLDVLRADPEHQRTLVILILALTDQFVIGQSAAEKLKQARSYAKELKDSYQNQYYTGIIAERQARAFIARRAPRSHAYNAFRDAMEWYEKADSHHAAGDEDAILRWNSCVRTIERERLEPEEGDQEHNLQD